MSGRRRRRSVVNPDLFDIDAIPDLDSSVLQRPLESTENEGIEIEMLGSDEDLGSDDPTTDKAILTPEPPN